MDDQPPLPNAHTGICSTTNETALNTSSLLCGVLFGAIGFGFFWYGRKQRAPVPLVCGLALMIFPYFIANTYVLVGIGITLIALPYFIRI